MAATGRPSRRPPPTTPTRGCSRRAPPSCPAGARYVAFSATGDFYAKFGAAAAVPAADVTDGSASALNPTQRRIPDDLTTIGLVAPAACTVTLSFWG